MPSLNTTSSIKNFNMANQHADDVYDELPLSHTIYDRPPTVTVSKQQLIHSATAPQSPSSTHSGSNNKSFQTSSQYNNGQPALSRLRCQSTNQPRNIYSSMRLYKNKSTNAHVYPAYNYSLKSRSTIMLSEEDPTEVVDIVHDDSFATVRPALSSNINGPLMATRKAAASATTTVAIPPSNTPVLSTPVIVSPLRQNEAFFNCSRAPSAQVGPVKILQQRQRGFAASSASLFSASSLRLNRNQAAVSRVVTSENFNDDLNTYAVPNNLSPMTNKANSVKDQTRTNSQNRESGFIDVGSSSSSSSSASSSRLSSASSTFSASISRHAVSPSTSYRNSNSKLPCGRKPMKTEQIYDQLPSALASKPRNGSNKASVTSAQQQRVADKTGKLQSTHIVSSSTIDAGFHNVMQDIHIKLDQLLITLETPFRPPNESHQAQLSDFNGPGLLSQPCSPKDTVPFHKAPQQQHDDVLNRMLELVSPHVLSAAFNGSITSQAAGTRLRDLIRETMRNATTLSHVWLSLQRLLYPLPTQKCDADSLNPQIDSTVISIRMACRDVCETLNAVLRFVLDFALVRVTASPVDNDRQMSVAHRLAALIEPIHTGYEELRNHIKLLSALKWDFEQSQQARNKCEQLVRHVQAFVADERLTELQGFVAGNAELIFPLTVVIQEEQNESLSPSFTMRRPLPRKPSIAHNKYLRENVDSKYSNGYSSGSDDEQQRQRQQSPSYDYVDYSLMDSVQPQSTEFLSQKADFLTCSSDFADKMVLFPTGSSNVSKSPTCGKALSDYNTDEQQRRFRANTNTASANKSFQNQNRRQTLTITRRIRRAVSFSKTQDERPTSVANADDVTPWSKMQAAKQRLPRWANELRRKAVNLIKH